MYSCLKDATDSGGSCFDPLFFHYPTEEETFTKIEDSFIFADTLKVSPILSQDDSNSSSMDSYFPKGRWINMNDYSDVIESKGGSDGWKKIPVDQS
jgi:alpha-glucosidase (family GH31 glycosyl hydrolase)